MPTTMCLHESGLHVPGLYCTHATVNDFVNNVTAGIEAVDNHQVSVVYYVMRGGYLRYGRLFSATDGVTSSVELLLSA